MSQVTGFVNRPEEGLVQGQWAVVLALRPFSLDKCVCPCPCLCPTDTVVCVPGIPIGPLYLAILLVIEHGLIKGPSVPSPAVSLLHHGGEENQTDFGPSRGVSCPE